MSSSHQAEGESSSMVLNLLHSPEYFHLLPLCACFVIGMLTLYLVDMLSGREKKVLSQSLL